MWEFMITTSIANKDVVKSIESRLQDISVDYKNIITNYQTENFYNVVFCCNKIERFKFKMYIEQFICDAICGIYKRKYLSNKINISLLDKVTSDAFLQALILFDMDTDRYLVNKYLNIQDKINLDSFFEFRLKSVKDKWQELVNIANDNQMAIYSNDTYIELIKFLVDSIEIKNDVINILKTDNGLTLANSEFDVVTENCYTEKIVANLIELCPKNINIYCSDDLPNDVTKLICQLFEKRVKFLKKVDCH